MLAWKVCLASLVLFGCFATVHGQVGPFEVHHEDGQDPWPPLVQRPDSSHSAWQSALLSTYYNLGYFEAQIDSVDWNEGVVFLKKGPLQIMVRASIAVRASERDMGELVIQEVVGGSEELWIEGEFMAERRIMSSSNMEDLLAQILLQATSKGYLAATAQIETFTPTEGGWEVGIELVTGKRFSITSVRLDGDNRTQPAYAARLSGIRPGSSASEVNLSQSRAALASAGLHRAVGIPVFELTDDSTAVVVIPATPLSAGTFDLMAGYLPGVGSAKSQFVGSGHIELLNAFGKGRELSARVDRFPGQSSGVELSFREPSLRAWPISLEGGFKGYQQDSTYSSSQFTLGLGLQIESNMEVILKVNREQTRPLQAGQEIQASNQRISRSSGTYLGIETKYSRLDNKAFPRRGVLVSVSVESGKRNRSGNQVVGQDTLRMGSAEQQRRFYLQARSYTTFSERWTLLLGADGQFSFADQLDESELVRLGGARSLRGYDENQFRGTSAGRTFAEMRAYLDLQTYGYVFYDLGFLEGVKNSTSKTKTLPGFGVGFAFVTAAGPISISYAMNTQDALSDGRIHLGLSFGL